MNKASSLILLFATPVLAAPVSPYLDLDIKGNVQAYWADSSVDNWWDRGSGQLEHSDSGASLGNQVFSLHAVPPGDFSFRLNGQYSQQTESELGITEAWASWSPLPINRYRVLVRAGAFYPSMSLENTDTAWTSPYTQSFSALNSWLAEELRVGAVEARITRPGRFFRSPHTLTAVAGAFQGNDALGTILSWRGFAIHNTQTLIGDQVDFAKYPSIQSGGLARQPAWVNPTPELDDRTGYYLGGHWSHRSGSEVRAYFYDNNGDPLVFEHGQYAWDTRFGSLAAFYPLNEDWSLVAQWMNGRTEMGPAAVVVDFDVWFTLLSLKQDNNRYSVRYDHFRTIDQDNYVGDDNDGQGEGWTLSWQHQLTPNLNAGLEAIYLDSRQDSRVQLGESASQSQSLVTAQIGYKW